MPASHVLALFDGSRAGERAISEATDLAREAGARLTILTLAAVEEPSRCCNMQTTSWNRDMRELAREELDRARSLLTVDVDAEFVIREGRGRSAVANAAADLGCDLIIEPGKRRGAPRRSAVAAGFNDAA